MSYTILAYVLGLSDTGNHLQYHSNDVFGSWQSKGVAIISVSTLIASLVLFSLGGQLQLILLYYVKYVLHIKQI